MVWETPKVEKSSVVGSNLEWGESPGLGEPPRVGESPRIGEQPGIWSHPVLSYSLCIKGEPSNNCMLDVAFI